jgi:ATP-dependent DNA helicase RecG
MTDEELRDILSELRSVRADGSAVEAKAAASGLPKSLRETLSAFSNSPGGGVVVLGVDERQEFAVTGITNPGKMQADFASMCNTMEPPVRANVDIQRVEGLDVLVAEIPELPPDAKPCYHVGAGLMNGAYIRSGDSDQRLTQYEVLMLRASAGRPREDLQPVPDGDMSELDAGLVEPLITTYRCPNVPSSRA